MGFFDFFKKKKKIDTICLEQQMDQKIFDILQSYLPNGWLEVVFFAGYYKNDSAYFKYWVKTDKGSFIDCFTLIPEPKPGEQDVLQKQFMQIHKVIKNVREQFDKKNKWVILTLSINYLGQMSKEYDYANRVLEENLMKYVEEFKNKLNKKYV